MTTPSLVRANLVKPITVFSQDVLERKIAALFIDNGIEIAEGPQRVLNWTGATTKLALKLCEKHTPWLSRAVSESSAWGIVVAIAREYESGFKLLSECTKSGARAKHINHPALIWESVARVSCALSISKTGRMPKREGLATPMAFGFRDGAIKFLNALSTETVSFNSPKPDAEISSRAKIEVFLQRLPEMNTVGAATFSDWERIDCTGQRKRLADLAEELAHHRGILERFIAAFPDGKNNLHEGLKEIEKREKKDKDAFMHELMSEDGYLASRVDEFLMSCGNEDSRVQRISITVSVGIHC